MSLSKKQIKIQEKMLNPFKFGVFKILKLPLAYLAGIKLTALTKENSVATVKYKYLNTKYP